MRRPSVAGASLVGLSLAVFGCGDWTKTDYRPFSFCSVARSCPPGQECTPWGVCARPCTECSGGDCGCGEKSWAQGSWGCVDAFCALNCDPYDTTTGNGGCWGNLACDPQGGVCRPLCTWGMGGPNEGCPPGSTCVFPTEGGGQAFCRPNGSQLDGGWPPDGGTPADGGWPFDAGWPSDGGPPGDGGIPPYEPLMRHGLSALAPGNDPRIFVVGGYAGGVETDRFEAYDPATGGWELLPSLPFPRAGLLFAMGGDGEYYALLGTYAGGPSDIVTSYNVYQDAWTTRSPAAIARGDVTGTATGGGAMYFFGGWLGGAAYSDEVWTYQTQTTLWNQRLPMPDTRRDFAATFLGGDQVYVIGGAMGASELDSVRLYDTFLDSWSTPSAGVTLSWPRAGLAAVSALNSMQIGVVIAMGGRYHDAVLDVVEVLEIPTGWRAGAPMPVPRADFAAVTSGDNRHVYVFGGVGADGFDLNRVDVYDSVTDSWTTP